MIFLDTSIEPAKIIPQKSLIELVEEVCATDPKPIYCERPEELKVSFHFTGGTVSRYIETVNFSHSIVGAASISTSKI